VLHSLLGRGPHGAVWRAERRGSPGRVLAVKLVDLRPSCPQGELRSGVEGPTAPRLARPGYGARGGDRSGIDRVVTRLRSIATTLRDTAHPHLLPIEDVEVADDRVAVFMPCAAGGSLHQVLGAQDAPRLPPAVVAALGADLAGALAACHAAGLRHGGLSTHNVLFGGDGRALLADVGLADALQRPEPTSELPSAATREEDTRALARLLAGVVRDDDTAGARELRQVLTTAVGGGRLDRTEAASGRGAEGRTEAAALAARLEGLRTATWSRLDIGAHDRRGVVTAATPPAGPRDGTVRQRPADVDVGGAEAQPRGVTPRRRGWIVVAAAVGVLAVALATGARLVHGDGPDEDRSHAAEHGVDRPPSAPPGGEVAAAPPDSTPSPTSGPRVPPALCSDATTSVPDRRHDGVEQIVSIDLDARGCGRVATFDGRRLRVLDATGRWQRFEVAGVPPGAVLLAGDWDCDGREGIALYLPSSGQTLRFDGLPEPGGELRAVPEPTGVRGGAATVVVDARGCAEVVVVPM
jgi:serine/threonine protein kinase